MDSIFDAPPPKIKVMVPGTQIEFIKRKSGQQNISSMSCSVMRVTQKVAGERDLTIREADDYYNNYT
jgi:hypothetical protein